MIRVTCRGAGVSLRSDWIHGVSNNETKEKQL